MAIAFLAVIYRSLFNIYQLWRSVSQELGNIETSHTCRCVTDPNEIYLLNSLDFAFALA